MAKYEVIAEEHIWTLDNFYSRGYRRAFPIEVRAGKVAINANTPVGNETVVCATHRVTLVPDLVHSLIQENPQLERICPIPDCTTRAHISAYNYGKLRGPKMKESWARLKKADAKRDPRNPRY